MAIIYATFEDMRGRVRDRLIIQLADVADIADAQPFVENRLASAGTKIDGYVANAYGDRSALPVPPQLKELALDLALYGMYESEPPEKVVKDRDAAIATLRDIASGKFKIDGGVPDAQPERPGAIIIDGGEKLFGRDRMRGF